MDKLLHWVLLNTVVRQQVEAALGGPIMHSTRTARSSDEVKVARQLGTMNVMERFGYPPDPSVWKEPGTLMEATRRMEVVDRTGQVRIVSSCFVTCSGTCC
jgi:hypothetical protein